MLLTINSQMIMETEASKGNPLFGTLDEKDFQHLKTAIEKVHNTGLAVLIIVPRQKLRKTYCRIELHPEFNNLGEVINVVAEFTPTSKTAYDTYTINKQEIGINSEISKFNALVTFDRQLNLRDYFTESKLDFNEVFSPEKKGIQILKKWASSLFKKITSSGILISEKDSGSMKLNLISMGLNKTTDLICIKIESVVVDLLVNVYNEISDLEKNILNTIPADIAIWDLDHRYIFLNKTACNDERIRNWFIGKNDFEYCNYRDKPIDNAIKRRITFNKMLLSGKQTSIEEQFETSEGPKYHLRIFQPLLDQNGQIKGALGYGLDITSVKNIESDFIKTKTAVKDAMDGIAILDKNGNYTAINEAHVNMFGYEQKNEFIGNSWHMLYEKNEINRLESKIFPVIMKTGRWIGETKGVSKNGSTIYQEISLTSLPDGGLICICRDKTKEKNQKQRLERAAIVADNTSSVVIITDPQTRIQWVNKAFTKITGYTLNEAIGKYPSLLHGPETDVKVIKRISENLKNKKSFSDEIINYSKNGRKYWVQVNIAPIFNDDGELINYISVENDITELKKVEENIKINLKKEKELNELKSQFVSIASHEIRTPLASIQSSADLIKLFINNDKVPKEKIERHLEKIESQITRLTAIMSNLLTVGRINLSKFDLHKNETNMENFIRDIINEYFSITSDNRNTIFNVTGAGQKSNIDRVLMSQVLINLISNAVKYSIGRSNPEVKLNYKKNYFTIQVKDYGIGIPKEQHKNIFKSFFRADNVENIQGTGLGLVIVKKFVEMHNGSISFTSNLGKGSTFEVKLPYK